MSNEGLEGKLETQENLNNFKEALVFLGREKFEYFESVEFILNNYESLINRANEIYIENMKNIMTSFKYLKTLGFFIFLNIPFYFFITETTAKFIFLTMNVGIFFCFFAVYVFLKVNLIKRKN